MIVAIIIIIASYFIVSENLNIYLAALLCSDVADILCGALLKNKRALHKRVGYARLVYGGTTLVPFSIRSSSNPKEFPLVSSCENLA